MTGFSGSGGDSSRVGCVLWGRLRGRLGGRGALSQETGARRLALPCSFSLMISYYGLVLDLQNLGSDIFLLQVLFGAVDLLGRATVTFLLRFFGRRTILAVFQAMAGLSILANMLVPQGEARAAGEGTPGPLLRLPAALPPPTPGPSSAQAWKARACGLRQARVGDRGGKGAEASVSAVFSGATGTRVQRAGASPGPRPFSGLSELLLFQVGDQGRGREGGTLASWLSVNTRGPHGQAEGQ